MMVDLILWLEKRGYHEENWNVRIWCGVRGGNCSRGVTTDGIVLYGGILRYECG